MSPSGDTPPTPAATADAPPAAADVKITADTFIGGDLTRSIPFAGLLASDANLAGAELTESEWEKRLASYLKSERP